MATIQVKSVPEAMHRRLRSCARTRGQTISQIVLDAVRRELEHQRFVELLSREPEVDLGVTAAELLDEARREAGRA